MFVIRIWRENSKENGQNWGKGATTNAYSCVELNAHALVLYMMVLREKNLHQFFHPDMLGSQQCENEFRSVRSFTPSFSTKTNCNIAEFINKIARVELLKIIPSLLPGWNFPRTFAPRSSCYPGERYDMNLLPSFREIREEIGYAMAEAIGTASSLGVMVSNDLVAKFNAPVYSTVPIRDLQPHHALMHGSIDVQDDFIIGLKRACLSRHHKKMAGRVEENDAYVCVRMSEQHIEHVFYVLKRTLVQILSQPSQPLSNDRLRRVRSQ